MASRTMGAAEFKAQCLKILDEIEQSGETVTVTKRGRPVAEVRPIDKPEEKLTFGCFKETILGFDDPFSPAYDGPWNAEKGMEKRPFPRSASGKSRCLRARGVSL